MESVPARVFTDHALSDAATLDGGGERGRDSLFLLARMTIDGLDGPVSVRVRNLSAGGLMAEMPDPVSPDSAVTVELRGLGRVTGRVAWQTEGRVGIAFDRPIDPQLARHPVGPRAVASGNRPVRFTR